MSSPNSTRPIVATLSPVAPDIRKALADDFELVPPDQVAALSEATRNSITHALTMAVGGAPDTILDLLPHLRVVASCGAGTDQFDQAALERRGIALRPTPEVMTTDTADMAVGLIYALLRGIVRNDAHVREGHWAKARAGLQTRVAGKRAGIVGLGRIGRTVADRLSGVGLSVSYTGPKEKPDAPYPYEADIARLADSVNILVLTCAGGAATRHLVGAEVLKSLGTTGFLVNVSRGSVVDEAALLNALESGAIAGAGLDVFENEPHPDPRFQALPNVVLQPHAATLTHENRADLADTLRRLLSEAGHPSHQAK